jgi:uncharacterized protein YutE (UPF0331/DUF86 family)
VIIEGRLDIISENIDYLRGVSKTELKTFSSDFEKIQATKHYLQEAIEACLDIANHIISAEGFPRAEDYGQFFRVLAEKNVLDKALAERLATMAKFRNLLVHRYGSIKPAELHKIVNEDLEDIEEYVREILRYAPAKNKRRK